MTDLTFDYYTPQDIDKAILKAGILDKCRKKNIEYINAPFAFDIETTSFYSTQMEKTAIMYEWSLGINGVVVIGRYWSEFLDVCMKLVEWFDLSENKRIVIYVHNLAFEFQFFRKLFKWLKVFSLEQRKPLQAITIEGIEFRCSYLLSGYSLANLSKQLNRYKVEKLVGDLDYLLLRSGKTPLTEKEIKYCINDVNVVMAYIQECIENYGGINKLPLTKTGFVRNYCRNECLYTNDDKHKTKYHKYRDLMKKLVLDKETYLQLKRAFSGGFTHASAYYSRDIMLNVSSFDFTSSYPYVMISEMFPMSSPIKVKPRDKQEFENYLKMYCCLFDIEFEGLESKVYYENYISKSHCFHLSGEFENNGRIVSAEHLETTITEQDYIIIKDFYKWKKCKIKNMRVFQKDYLPTDLVRSILKLYYDKTTLKDVIGKEVEYMQSKERINAIYGMSVTDICRDESIYEDEWTSEKSDIEKDLSHYNKSVKRFLYYPWGIWVTAYARKNLFTGIKEFGYDYIYSDTDSVKVINKDLHLDYINRYNNKVIKKLEKAMEFHNLDIELTRPKNIKGEQKQIGIWEEEKPYEKFKTLGAKRYIVEQDGEIKITVSGLNKKVASNYLFEKYGDNVFNAFDDNLYVPAKYTGKMTHTYIDEERVGVIKDYLGNVEKYCEKSSVHLENAEYSLSLLDAYINYLNDVQTFEK